MADKRLKVYYSGMVQGVGFRFTAERMAGRLGITGWVRNLPDGRVELLAEGAEERLKDLLSNIKNSTLGSYIRDAEVKWSEPTGEFNGFGIRFA